MNLLYYWRGDNYASDIACGLAYHLNAKADRLHEVNLGESLWAFTRRPDGAYVLAAELVVSAKTRNAADYVYGTYRVWGGMGSRYFDTDRSPEAEATIRKLSVQPRTPVLGHSFQGPGAIRALGKEDHRLLQTFAAALPLLVERDALLSEEHLELAIRAGDIDTVERMVDRAPLLSAERRMYLVRVYQRRHSLLRELRQRYAGRCQLCGWDPVGLYGTELCEAYHLHWLSRGGQDALDNIALLCPNDHRRVHALDAPIDHGATGVGFRFGERMEPLTFAGHLE